MRTLSQQIRDTPASMQGQSANRPTEVSVSPFKQYCSDRYPYGTSGQSAGLSSPPKIKRTRTHARLASIASASSLKPLPPLPTLGNSDLGSEDESSSACASKPGPSNQSMPQRDGRRGTGTFAGPIYDRAPRISDGYNTYIQSYARAALENDHYMFKLLEKLNPSKSPAFSKHQDNPLHVLDLGCGDGSWANAAAVKWEASGTVVTAFDLVHVQKFPEEHLRNIRPPKLHRNVRWVRGDFLDGPLPFHAESFDFVRMANLQMCIPDHRWDDVFKEVYRVLRPGGQVELINDDILFPKCNVRPQVPPSKAPLTRSESFKHSPPQRAATLGESSRRPLDTLVRRNTSSAVTTPRLKDIVPKITFAAKADIASHLETIFLGMLIRRCGISPLPSADILRSMCRVFGGLAKRIHEFQVEIPTRASFSLSTADQRRLSIDKARSRAPSVSGSEFPQTPGPFSPLGGSFKPRSAFSNSKVAQRPSDEILESSALEEPEFQPPGLVVMPSTFLPMSPEELELHACKHMNTLLACKRALTQFVLDQGKYSDDLHLEEEAFHEFLWQYHRFRRERFHWPTYCDEWQSQQQNASTTRPKLFHSRSEGSSASGLPHVDLTTLACDPERMVTVRRIRVYSAAKPMLSAYHAGRTSHLR